MAKDRAAQERELASYFEDRKDDLSEWEAKPRKIRVRRGGPSTVFSVRLTTEELKVVQDAAAAQGINASEFIRRAALAASRSQDGGSDAELAALVKELESSLATASRRLKQVRGRSSLRKSA